MALAQLSEEKGLNPEIKAVLTVGEKLTQDVRDEVRRIWGCRISDVYATAEAGLVAIECPDGGGYHLQTEITRTEVVGDRGETCGSGETGQIICTSVYNFAMPMIRYCFRDLVTIGKPCQCGRGLPVLSEIKGRTSSLLKAPNGTLYAPEISTRRIFELCGAREWQLDQKGEDNFVLKLKAQPNTQQKAALQNYVMGHLHDGAVVSTETVLTLQRSKGGKFYPIVRSSQA
jgi:phenylacetate-CoA ligase